MTHSSAATTAGRHLIIRRALVAAVFVGAGLASAGCSLFETGVSMQDAHAQDKVAPRAATQPGVASTSAKAGTPADKMFTDDGPTPFSKPASIVNVFGEVDGVGPSPFQGPGGSSGFQQHTFVDEGYDADPCVSPDGQWLLFASTRHNEHADVYLQRIDGLAVTQLTMDDADDTYPRFSRDGKRVVFASNRAGNYDIYVMDIDGSRVRQITRSPAQDLHPSFSPDGNRIVYSSLGSKSGQWELWTIDLRNNERRMIGYGLFPDWSPRTDRDVIAFQRARQRGTRWFSAWTLELADGEPVDVTEVAYSRRAAVVAPTWNANGTRLAFCTIADPQKAPANAKGGSLNKGGREDVWTVAADGTDRRQITDGRGVNASPAWSNDGRVFFISDRGGSESIWSLSAEHFGDGVSNPRTASATPTVVDPFESKTLPPTPHVAASVEAPIELPVETPAVEKPITPQAEVTVHEAPVEEAAHEQPVHGVPHAAAHE